MKDRVLAEPVLVGRERELEQLMQCLDSAAEGKGTTVFVSGEAGSGKTRLVNEFLKVVKEKEGVVLSGWCLSDLAVPYFPFIQAFTAYFSEKSSEEKSPRKSKPQLQSEPNEDEEAEIKAWLMGPKQTGKSERLQNLTPQAWQDLTFAAVTKAIISLSDTKTTLFIVEDIHWADSASLALLHYIARAILSERVLVIGTFRREDLTVDAEGRPHPLVETLRLMGREDLFKEIKLQGLSTPNVNIIAENMLGGSVDPDVVEKLARESQGNALFVVESLRMLHEQGNFLQKNDRWQLSADALGIPSKVKDIILRRLGMLKSNQRRVLDVASVMGDKFDIELLSAVLGQDSLGVLETLDAIGRSSSLVSCEGDSYRFDHAKSREIVYDEISLPLKKAYHTRIAQRLEAISQDAILPFSDLTYHYAQAGRKEEAIKYALAAGKDALVRFSNTEAIKHFTYVLDNFPEASESGTDRISALEGLGDGFQANGLFREALRAFEQLSKSAKSDQVKLRALRKAVSASFWRGDPNHSLELANRAKEYATLDRLEYARVLLYKGIAVSSENIKQALEDAEEALRVFEEEYSLPDVASALVETANYFVAENRLEDALAAVVRSTALCGDLGDLREQMYAYTYSGTVFTQCGLVERAFGDYAKAIEIGEKIGDHNRLAWALFLSALALESAAGKRLLSRMSSAFIRNFGARAKVGFFFSTFFSGELREAKRDFKTAIAQSLKAVEYAEKTDAYYIQSLSYGNLVRLYIRLGDMENAERYYEKFVKVFDATRMASDKLKMAHGLGALSKAAFFSDRKQWAQANEYYEECLKRVKKHSSSSMFEMGGHIAYALSLAAQGRTEDAQMQFEKAKKILENLQNRFCRANIYANLMVSRNIEIGEEFSIRLDLANISRNSSLLVRVENLIPQEFKVTAMPLYCISRDSSIEMKERSISPFQIESVKFRLEATKTGTFNLNPQVIYIDDMGETRTCTLNPITMTVKSAQPKYEVLPGRVSIGSEDINALLFGGIPQNFAVALTSSAIDARDRLIRRFLAAGTSAGEATFYITTEAANAKALTEKSPPNFFLFICNPRADAIIESLPNVSKFKGVENLTEIDIALAKVSRIFDQSKPAPKRACIDIVSDVLLQHHAVTTRKWLGGVLADLRAKGFTTLATINPEMHPPEEVQAILGLFDGEMSIYEKETPKGSASFLKVKKMTGQKYLKDEIPLTEE